MDGTWQLQEAKNKLSEVVAQAASAGPQHITKHGKEAAVVVSADHYRRLSRGTGDLAEFFRSSPLIEGSAHIPAFAPPIGTPKVPNL